MNAKITAAVGAALVAAAASVGMLPPPKDDPALSRYQQRCAQALSFFIGRIPQAYPNLQVTLGEAHRPTWVAAEYARRGMGIATSLHTQRLAVDLMLFENGVYQTNGERYRPLAVLWKAVAPAFGVVPGAGIDFNDGNHFSCAWQGRR
jgi:hypothetical protein